MYEVSIFLRLLRRVEFVLNLPYEMFRKNNDRNDWYSFIHTRCDTVILFSARFTDDFQTKFSRKGNFCVEFDGLLLSAEFQTETLVT